MAQALCYFTLLYFGWWKVTAFMAAGDFLDLGPSTLGGALSGFAGFLMFA